MRDKLPKTLKSSIRDAVERAVDAKVSSVEDKNKNNDDEEISDLKKKPSESATKNQTSSSRVAVEKEAASKVFEAPSNSFEFKKKSAASETDKAIFSRPREGEKQPEVHVCHWRTPPEPHMDETNWPTFHHFAPADGTLSCF